MRTLEFTNYGHNHKGPQKSFQASKSLPCGTISLEML